MIFRTTIKCPRCGVRNSVPKNLAEKRRCKRCDAPLYVLDAPGPWAKPHYLIVSKPGILKRVRRRLGASGRIGWPSHKVLITAAVALVGGYLVLDKGGFFRTKCDIKGNISRYGSQKIYHMPGDHYYSKTRISRAKGEKWFCSEIEAWLHGFRRARAPKKSNFRNLIVR